MRDVEELKSLVTMQSKTIDHKWGVTVSKEVIGSVLVVGGGIAGIQAALDIAHSGYYVYLLERSPSIGGSMAQPDKIFPSNDCSMCMLSPKLVEAGQHQNIDLITYTNLESVEGLAGNFKVKIKTGARSIDVNICTGWGSCIENCPITNQPKLNP